MVNELRREHGSTIVLATHNVHQARRLSSTVTMLLDGRLIEVGARERLLADGSAGADTRTRAFIEGAMIY